MKKRSRVFLSLLIACLFCMGVPAFALESSPQSAGELSASAPRWSNTDTITMGLTFSGGSANCTVIIKGKVDTEAIFATIRLEEELADGSYSLVDEWDTNVDGDMLTFAQKCPVSRGDYVLSIDCTVSRYGSDENIYKEKSNTH